MATKITKTERGRGRAHGAGPRYWSQRVTETSNALDLEAGVFSLEDPAAIARSLSRSAERSTRRKSDPYRSAMSMLTFYVNRAGKNLPPQKREILERAKEELRALYHKRPRAPSRSRRGPRRPSAPASPSSG